MARLSNAGQALRTLMALGIAALSAPAGAGSFDLPFGIDGSYKLTTTYSLAVRMQERSRALSDGEVDNFQSVVYPQPDDFNRVIGFGHTGLPSTINFDDGNKNFDRYSPVNNRLSAFYEVQLRRDNFGLLVSGNGFYDWVFHEDTDRDPVNPDDPNDYAPNTLACSADRENCAYNKFSDGAVYYNGERSRLLEAYAYADFFITDDIAVNVRFGKHLVAWGESLFFPGIVSAQGPFDATKAFIPGAEIKEILLPVNQVSGTIAIGYNFSLMGYYQLDYKPSEVFPVGDFFSVADVVGPGAELAYGSGNPAYGDNCPGLFSIPGLPFDPSLICGLGGGAGGGLINAPRTIDVPREKDIRPGKKGQWGAGIKAQVTPTTSLGAYYIKYHNHNPTVNLNFGYARIGDNPVTGQPVTTQLINQSVPVSYNVKYFGDITMIAGSWTTTLLGLNFAGDLIYRDGIDVSVAADISGVLSPVFSPAKTYQANISSLYVANPKFWFYDEVAIVGEAAYLYVADVEPIQRFNGQEPRGDGKVMFYDDKAWAYQLLMLPKGRNVVAGWDLGTPISFAHAVDGQASTAGTFGSLFGEGDMRASLGITAQYLQNLEIAIAYNWFMGKSSATVKDSPIPSHPVSDRDYATLSIKYNL
ncbi:DUF1302 family protein [Fontimonas sp. SYSU GA230001]|uniref:DUF1302 domain-containing protein n=1 Tax=Fontimonas sp. SYSU GA230001 TaxID=3142450 RepID=UPI0032B54AB1